MSSWATSRSGRRQCCSSTKASTDGCSRTPLELAAVSYLNIVLTDTTNNVSTSVPDVSRIFFDV
jgi:hypothetical protein